MLTYDMGRRGSDTLYAHLYKCLRADIESARLMAGDRLPSKRRLAEHLGVSVITVEAAYRQLLAEGYVESAERRGYFVARGASGQARAARPLVPSHAMASGPAHGSGAQRFVPTLPDEEAELGSAGLFSLRNWARITREVLAEEDERSLLGQTDPLGSPRLRAAICRHLAQTRGLAATPDQVVVGAGSKLLDAMLAQLLGRDLCFAVEDPGYPQLRRLYQASGVRVVPVGMDVAGLVVDGLRSNGADVAHVTPSHQFPTGVVMPVGRRYELLAWAAERPRRYVVEDDYDCEFRLSGLPAPTLQSVDVAGRVIYTNTFTKSLGPAFRVAYAVLPEALARRWRDELSFASGTVGTVDQLVLARVIESGSFERHVSRTRTRCRHLRDQLLLALEGELGVRLADVRSKDAGLHFVLRLELPSGTSDQELERACREAGVPLRAMSGFYAGGEAPEADRHAFVMSYSSLGESDVASVAARLAALVRNAR